MKIKALIFSVLCACSISLQAQQIPPDTLRTTRKDSTMLRPRADLTIPSDSSAKHTHSPRTATLRSVVLPGWGQAYNKKYWKIPLIYVGAASLIYGLSWNHKNYKQFSQIYTYINDSNSSTVPYYKGQQLDSYYSTWAASNRDYFRKNRDMCAIGLGVVYVLNIIDANVDAHLFEFNVNDDLSLRLEPRVFALNGIGYNGFGATLKFK